MSEKYTFGWLRGKRCITFYDPTTGKRHRHTLGTADAGEAKRLAPSLYAELTRPRGTTVGELWGAYEKEYDGRAILEAMETTAKRLRARFWSMQAEMITIDDCREHMKEQRAAGYSEWSLYSELNHLRNVLQWAGRRKLLSPDKVPFIQLPPQPPPKEDKHLTREQVKGLINACHLPHTKLAVILLYTTAARVSALLGLTWDRCDFIRGQIDLRDPTISRPHKGRAIVPMLRLARAALLEAQPGALTDYVIEWAGEQVGSIKKSIKTAASGAKIEKTVSPHVLRHSAAVHMAEDGRSMEDIRQFLGHSDIKVTTKIYARFSPTYLRDAASALELDDLEEAG